MMKRQTTSSPRTKTGERQPLVGALLRMTYQVTRERILRALVDRGVSDLNQAFLNVMVYPHPDNVRPGDLAERTNMTKQAMNYLLGQLETLGYIERRGETSGRRHIFLTDRGWQVVEISLATVREIETEWVAALGRRRFNDFVDALQQLSSMSSKGIDQRRSQRRSASVSSKSSAVASVK